MAGFKGRELYSVDDKGRVSFPAKMVKHVPVKGKGARKFTVSRGWDRQGSLYVYPQEAWEIMEADLRARLNPFIEKDRLFLREISEHAEETELDGAGRFIVPRHLLELAGIERQALIVGAFDHIELWNPDRYRVVQEATSANISDLAAEVLGGHRA